MAVPSLLWWKYALSENEKVPRLLAAPPYSDRFQLLGTYREDPIDQLLLQQISFKPRDHRLAVAGRNLAVKGLGL